jgi:hypothetical protein
LLSKPNRNNQFQNLLSLRRLDKRQRLRLHLPQLTLLTLIHLLFPVGLQL